MNLDIVKYSPKGTNTFLTLNGIDKSSTIGEIKKLIAEKTGRSIYPARIALRLEAKGKTLNDNEKLSNLSFDSGNQLFFKDLGPQIGWATVFLCEYAGPIFCYLIFYFRPEIVYGYRAKTVPYHKVVHIAAAVWTLHYLKRILETLFIHRFSHATMPMLNLYKNCVYYWGFALFIGYFNNHPLYTPAYFGDLQIYTCLLGIIICELGNFSIHIALRNLRPPGTTDRRIPTPTGNPFTLLFNLVSCPNYTYEWIAWLLIAAMTQSLPCLCFATLGGLQMTIWAKGKQRNYKKQFPNYPRGRKAIIPFLV